MGAGHCVPIFGDRYIHVYIASKVQPSITGGQPACQRGMRSLGLGLGLSAATDGGPATPVSAAGAAAANLDSNAAAAALRWSAAATVQPDGGSVSTVRPEMRHGHTATAIPGGRVVVVGGVCSHSDQGPLRDVDLLHTDTMTWQRGPDCPARTGICFHSATFVPTAAAGASGNSEPEGQVVVLGGVGEAPRSMVSCTALHTQAPCTWSRQEAMQEPGYPEPRQSHSALLVDRCRIFVCGGVGQHLPSGEAFSDVWIFHLDSLLWLKAEPSGAAFPGRGGHTASLLGRQMLVFGGGVGAGGSAHFNDLWAFDVDQHLWVQVETEPGVPLPMPRTGHVAVALSRPPPLGGWGAADADDIFSAQDESESSPGMVAVGSLLVLGGQGVSARSYLALSSKEIFHADSWHAELLLPRTVAAKALSAGGAADADDGLLLLPSPTPAHTVGARLRLRWHGPLNSPTLPATGSPASSPPSAGALQ
jgi:N-acetylneuraminic acid mutarotase